MAVAIMSPSEIVADLQTAKRRKIGGPRDARLLMQDLRRLWKAAERILDLELMHELEQLAKDVKGGVHLALDHMTPRKENVPAYRVAWQYAKAYGDVEAMARVERIVAGIENDEPDPPSSPAPFRNAAGRTVAEEHAITDEIFGDPPKQAPLPVKASVRKFHNGTYTVVYGGNVENYFTFRLVDDFRKDGPEGAQVVEYLSGPHNERDFTGCAFLEGNKVKTWRKFKNGEISNQVHRAIGALESRGPEGRRAAMEAYALQSGKCANCGRTLTVAASIHRGLGPDCAAKLGVL